MSDLKVDKAVKTYLQDFGLTDKEIVVYVSLLKSGPSSIMNIARRTGIKRSTCHNYVEELIAKGLVSQTNYGERRMVVAEDPEKLKFLLEQRKWDVKKLEKNMPDVLQSIYGLIPNAKENSSVDVKYYVGKDGTQLIYKEAFASAELRSYVNLGMMSETFPENAHFFKDISSKVKNQVVLEIVDNSEKTAKLVEDFVQTKNFKFKVADPSLNLVSMDILIYDGKVAMVNVSDTIKGTIIDNKEYYENMKSMFDFIWSRL